MGKTFVLSGASVRISGPFFLAFSNAIGENDKNFGVSIVSILHFLATLAIPAIRVYSRKFAAEKILVLMLP